MTAFIEEPAVRLVEVAKRAGLTVAEVKAEAEALSLFVGESWAHEPALSTADAYRLVDGSARRNLDHDNAWRAHTEALQQWQDERESVRRRAFDEAWQAAVRARRNNGPATDMGHAAGREAVAAYEKSHPEPVFHEPETRVTSWIRKVKAGTR